MGTRYQRLLTRDYQGSSVIHGTDLFDQFYGEIRNQVSTLSVAALYCPQMYMLSALIELAVITENHIP